MGLSRTVHAWACRRSELRTARRECLADMAARDVSPLDMRDLLAAHGWTPAMLDWLTREVSGDDDA